MPSYVTRFDSTDNGAPVMSGTVGALTSVLSHCLIIGKVFSTANDAVFNDNTTEARLTGGTAFTLFPTPATGDRTYFGESSKFTRLKLVFGTVGTAATYVWEYWNGSAWAILTVVDGTTNFTANGSVTWTAPSNWATTAVNGITMYWVRVRFTGSAPTINPLVNSVSYLGWLEEFSGTNQRDYRAGVGNRLYLSVNDNAVGAGGAKEARASGFEAMTALGTGTGQFPTTAQVATLLTWRKSLTADATARAWLCLADERTFYLFVLTGDVANTYYECYFGDLYSMADSDLYAALIIGAASENQSNTRNFGRLEGDSTSLIVGHYMPRSYTTLGTSIQIGKHGDYAKGVSNQMIGQVPYLNGPDGKAYTAPIWVYESASHIRGRMRGLRHWLHAAASLVHGDTFSGVGTLAGKTFVYVRQLSFPGGVAVIETTDAWETN